MRFNRITIYFMNQHLIDPNWSKQKWSNVNTESVSHNQFWIWHVRTKKIYEEIIQYTIILVWLRQEEMTETWCNAIFLFIFYFYWFTVTSDALRPGTAITYGFAGWITFTIEFILTNYVEFLVDSFYDTPLIIYLDSSNEKKWNFFSLYCPIHSIIDCRPLQMNSQYIFIAEKLSWGHKSQVVVWKNRQRVFLVRRGMRRIPFALSA